jgi:MFS family permease
MNRRMTGLWRHPEFMKLWFGQTISEFGSRISREGLPMIAVITLAATPAQMGVLAAFASIPVLLFGVIAGVWVDRLARRPLMILMDVGRMALLLTIPIAALTGTLRIELVYIVVALMGVMSLIFETAYRAILPTLIRRDQLLEGNSKLSTTDALAEIGGPSIAGLLIQWISAPLAVIFDAISFLFSSISFALMRAPETKPERHAGARSMLREAREGWDVISGEPVLRTLMIGMGARSFFGSFFAALYSIYAIRELGLSPAMLGVVVSAGGIGALIGALLAGRVERRLGLGRALTWTLLLSAAVGFLTPLAGIFGVPVLAALLLIAAQIVGDAAMLVFGVNETSLRQTIVPDRLLGRTNATFGFLAEGVAPVGALVAGALATVIGAGATLGIAVVGFLVTAIWMWRSPIRALTGYTELAQ